MYVLKNKGGGHVRVENRIMKQKKEQTIRLLFFIYRSCAQITKYFYQTWDSRTVRRALAHIDKTSPFCTCGFWDCSKYNSRSKYSFVFDLLKYF